MINLTKTYTTENKEKVVLFEIFQGTVYGRLKNRYGGWEPHSWDEVTLKSTENYNNSYLVEVK